MELLNLPRPWKSRVTGEHCAVPRTEEGGGSRAPTSSLPPHPLPEGEKAQQVTGLCSNVPLSALNTTKEVTQGTIAEIGPHKNQIGRAEKTRNYFYQEVLGKIKHFLPQISTVLRLQYHRKVGFSRLVPPSSDFIILKSKNLLRLFPPDNGGGSCFAPAAPPRSCVLSSRAPPWPQVDFRILPGAPAGEGSAPS